jgi:hypothetical protein
MTMAKNFDILRDKVVSDEETRKSVEALKAQMLAELEAYEEDNEGE